MERHIQALLDWSAASIGTNGCNDGKGSDGRNGNGGSSSNSSSRITTGDGSDSSKSVNVKLDGIRPLQIPGRGIGVVATRKLKAGETILRVPVRSILRLATVSADIKQRLPRDVSIQTLLAAEIVHVIREGRADANADLGPGADVLAPGWAGLLPTWADLEASMPLLWPKELQVLLPVGAAKMLAKQQELFETAWYSMQQAATGVTRDEYARAWLLVNSRTFYDATDEADKYPWHDRLALMPVADLFNHGGTGQRSGMPNGSDKGVGCSMVIEEDGSYALTTRRVHAKGEEVLISYGDHDNDFLLVEYGFVLPDDNSQSCDLCLDEVILPRLGADQRRRLAAVAGDSELGGYVVRVDGTAAAEASAAAMEAVRELAMAPTMPPRATATTTTTTSSSPISTSDKSRTPTQTRTATHRRMNPEEVSSSTATVDTEEVGAARAGGWPMINSPSDAGDAGGASEKQVLRQLVHELLETTLQRLQEAQSIRVGMEAQRGLLLRRWEQLARISRVVLERLGGRSIDG